eukprot:1161280-Pelagomonas_calceolata.AAC.3
MPAGTRGLTPKFQNDSPRGKTSSLMAHMMEHASNMRTLQRTAKNNRASTASAPITSSPPPPPPPPAAMPAALSPSMPAPPRMPAPEGSEARATAVLMPAVAPACVHARTHAEAFERCSSQMQKSEGASSGGQDHGWVVRPSAGRVRAVSARSIPVLAPAATLLHAHTVIKNGATVLKCANSTQWRPSSFLRCICCSITACAQNAKNGMHLGVGGRYLSKRCHLGLQGGAHPTIILVLTPSQLLEQ